MEEFKSALRGVTSISSKFGDLAAKIGLDEFAGDEAPGNP